MQSREGKYHLAKKTYLWIEDRENKSGYTFWKNFLDCIFPDVILESKENNSKLLKAVRDLTDNENTYIIAYDHSFDNPQVVQTALNILYFPDKIFGIQECGDNALNVIYSYEQGNVYCEYPMISFQMSRVALVDQYGKHITDDYEVVKEWWSNVQ